jgi:hypothetical protein
MGIRAARYTDDPTRIVIPPVPSDAEGSDSAAAEEPRDFSSLALQSVQRTERFCTACCHCGKLGENSAER